MKPLERLRLQGSVASVDTEGAATFAHDGAAGILLLPGDPTRPEVTDVAVVLGELAERFPKLRVAVAHEGDEPAMRARFGVKNFPALLFVKGGEVVTTLARMQSWSTYEGAARAIEEGALVSAPMEVDLRGRRRLPVFGETEAPALLGLAAPMQARQGIHLPDSDDLSPRAFALLSAVRDALVSAPAEDVTKVFSLDDLDAKDRAELWDMLGEGEVSIVVQGASRYEIEETALPGVYRVRTCKKDGDSLHLEVGAIPAVVVVAAHHGTSPTMVLDDPPPAGLMNAQPLLAELQHRMATHEAGTENHVVSLSLLPMNDADNMYLARTLGAGPIKAESRGYGTCRVTATSLRGIWSVQHFNAMDTLILDTLEVGTVPTSLIAAAMDLEDSGTRLDELLDYVRKTS